MVRELASHQCGPGSNPGTDAICELSLLLVISFATRGFSPGTPVFSSPQKPTFSNSNLTRNQVDKVPLCVRFTKILTWIRILYDGKENGIRDRDNRSSGCSVVMKKEQKCSIRNQHPPPTPFKRCNLPELISSINISCYHCLINVNSMDSKTLNHNCCIFFIHKKIPHSPSLPFSDT